jgi:hypothetical protein
MSKSDLRSSKSFRAKIFILSIDFDADWFKFELTVLPRQHYDPLIDLELWAFIKVLIFIKYELSNQTIVSILAIYM